MVHTIKTGSIPTNQWYKKWFDSSFYHKLYANRDEHEASRFINNLLSELEPPPGSRMLDLGCGNGRHSKSLSNRGYDVTGIDLSSSSIQQAKRWESETLRFRNGNMLYPFGSNLYDYVFNFFTSFGYFDNDADDHRVCNNISRSLRNGGYLVMDYMNAVVAEEKLIADESKEIDGVHYRICRWSDEKFIYKKISIEEPLFAEPLEYIEQVRKFSLGEFNELFFANGLKIRKLFGDYELNEFNSLKSPRIILIAENY